MQKQQESNQGKDIQLPIRSVAAFSCCATDVLVEEDVDAVREIVRTVSQRLAASSVGNEQRKEVWSIHT
jgi:hypothetical protein